MDGKSIGLAAAIALALAPQASGQARDPFTVQYLGTITCGSWPKYSKVGDVEKAVKLNLVLGLLAGRASKTKVDTLANTDAESVGAWMDNYCAANPLDDIVEAMFALEKELLARQGVK